MVRRLAVILLLGLAIGVSAQTADITEGCVPLTVQFGSDPLSDYFWDFDDGGSSNAQSPEHIFTSPGTYTVSLKQGAQGQTIGTVTIQVFADPVITISYDQPDGCIPSEVTFTPSITLDANVTITEYQWIFGDGNVSNQLSPTHTYTDRGTFTVSLSIKTDKTECDYLEIFPDLVDAFGITSNFTFDSPDLCKVPASVLFRYNGDNLPGSTYNWDFGNGETSAQQNPPIITYNDVGEYQVVLVATSPSGCVSTDTSTVITNEPMIDAIYRDSICAGELFTIGVTPFCEKYIWNFPPAWRPDLSLHLTAEGDLVYNNIVTGWFDTVETNVVSVICVTENGCQIDSTFTMHSIKPDAEFTLSPTFGCADTEIIDFEVVDKGLALYWVNGEPLESFTWSDTIICPQRDSFFANRQLPFGYEVMVEDYLGCRDTVLHNYIQNKTEACILAEPNNGCVPLTVNLLNHTLSLYELTTTDWDLGDGTEQTTIGRDSITHIYTEPGDYYVKMVTRNSEGCQDTSAGVWIHVGDVASADLEIITMGDCFGGETEFNLIDATDNIDDWSYGGVLNTHCPMSKTYPLTVILPLLTLEDNGCFTQVPVTAEVDLPPGSTPEIKYSISCDRPFDVDLRLFGDILTGESLEWFVDGELVSTQLAFTHTFDTAGDHQIVVELANADPDCGVSVDTQTIRITDLRAVLDVDSVFCKGDLMLMDASGSTDVFTQSGKGYTYTIGNDRPYTRIEDSYEYLLRTPGWQTVTLKVVDQNGCIDTQSKQVLVHEIEADFSLPSDSLCVNGTYLMTNLSQSDTTYQSTHWTAIDIDTVPSWDPISTEFEPAFDYDQLASEIRDSILTLTLAIQDHHGCADTVSHEYAMYDVIADISFDPGPGICLGTEITFEQDAEGFQEENYLISWDLGDGTTSQDAEVAHTYQSNGLYEVTLNLTESQYQCNASTTTLIDVVNPPIADFTTSIDGVDPICYPTAVQFIDQSTIDGFALYAWDMSGDLIVNIEDPVYAFGKGEQTVTLSVLSPYGCTDSTSVSFDLVGPEGILLVDNDTLCRDDILTGIVTDLVDVNLISWDLGDGTVVDAAEEVSHQYTFAPPSGETVLKVVLKSDDNGCESILEHPVVIGVIDPSFTFDVEQGFCGNVVNFFATDSIADIFTWDFGDGAAEMGPEVTQEYPTGGNYVIGLTVTDELSGCVESLTEEIALQEQEAGFVMPNMFTPNGDNTNDFFNWVPQGIDESEIEIVTFKVYNRWGNLVYDNATPSTGWDGMHTNSQAPTEVYAYYIELSITDCGVKSKKGNVTLIR